jgi:RNA polymerase sigma-70 factor (ECF subfamily)
MADDPRDATPEDAVTDKSLLRRVRGGQADASTLLYLRYAERLNALAARQSSPDLARRVAPDEIVQSVFRTFFRRVVQGHYDVPEGEEIWKLLLVIALNKVRTAAVHHRAAKRDVGRTSAGATYDRAMETAEGRDETALTVLRLVIDEILSGLDATRRQIIEMRIEGHEVAEIGEAVQRSKRSVERVLQEFRARLGALIHEDE